MFSLRVLSRLACPLLALAAASPAGAQVRIPGSRATLVPPPGFSVSAHGAGLQHDSLPAAIQVSELLGDAWNDLRGGLTRAALAAAGMAVGDSSTITLRGAPALRFSITQRRGGVDYGKEMLVTRDSASTFMVVASWEIGTPPEVVASMRAAMLTLGVTVASEDPFDGLAFRADPAPELPVWKRLGGGLGFSETEAVPAPHGEAQVVLALGDGAVALVGDKEAWMTGYLQRLPGFRGLSDLHVRAVEIAGADAWELTANAVDADSGLPLLIHSVAVPYGRFSTLMMVGQVGSDRADAFLPVFRHMAAGIRFTASPQ